MLLFSFIDLENIDPNGSGGNYAIGIGNQRKNGQGKQIINLSKSGFTNHTIIHEFIHKWGFFHEQSRPDRG